MNYNYKKKKLDWFETLLTKDKVLLVAKDIKSVYKLDTNLDLNYPFNNFQKVKIDYY